MNKIEIIPLGGIGEFGMNCMGIRYRDEMIIVDAGMGFPEETPYGVDISIPNFDFLEEYRDDLTAIILTHGHEDHIGALAYILRNSTCRFTLRDSRSPWPKSGSKNSTCWTMSCCIASRPDDTIEIGSFKIEFIHASHSLVECFSLAIHTPVGTLIHTGDYKIDDTPVIGKPYDLKTLRRIGDEGVLALLCDSTNSTVPGRTPSERAVIPAFEEIFEQAEGRIICRDIFFLGTSAADRFRYGAGIRQKSLRLGRSMQRNVEIARRAGSVENSATTR